MRLEMAILKNPTNRSIGNIFFDRLRIVTVVKMSDTDQRLREQLNIDSIYRKFNYLADLDAIALNLKSGPFE